TSRRAGMHPSGGSSPLPRTVPSAHPRCCPARSCRRNPGTVRSPYLEHSRAALNGRLAHVDLERARYLTSSAARRALESLDPALAALPPIRLADRLRRDFPPFEAAALAEQLVLRARARERFGGELPFLYSSPGLEMMT